MKFHASEIPTLDIAGKRLMLRHLCVQWFLRFHDEFYDFICIKKKERCKTCKTNGLLTSYYYDSTFCSTAPSSE